MTGSSFQSLLQNYFTDRLFRQRQASPHTIASYRDTFLLLLRFAEKQLGTDPTDLKFEQLDTVFVGDFLDHIEKVRGNTVRSRNTRLAAIRSFFRYVSLHEPAYALHCRQVLAIPSKRHERRPIAFLSSTEIDELIKAPDQSTWAGRRDRTLLMLAIQTGLRVSELIALRRKDVQLGTGAHVTCQGKGRKQRCTPLRRDVVSIVEAWLRQRPIEPDVPVFPNIYGTTLSRDAVEKLLEKHTIAAAERCPSLKQKNITAHVLRHTAAMQLLQSGVDRSVIALWLGHESMDTTEIYLHADMQMKERALALTKPTGVKPGRFRPNEGLLAFLEGL